MQAGYNCPGKHEMDLNGALMFLWTVSLFMPSMDVAPLIFKQSSRLPHKAHQLFTCSSSWCTHCAGHCLFVCACGFILLLPLHRNKQKLVLSGFCFFCCCCAVGREKAALINFSLNCKFHFGTWAHLILSSYHTKCSKLNGFMRKYSQFSMFDCHRSCCSGIRVAIGFTYEEIMFILWKHVPPLTTKGIANCFDKWLI